MYKRETRVDDLYWYDIDVISEKNKSPEQITQKEIKEHGWTKWGFEVKRDFIYGLQDRQRGYCPKCKTFYSDIRWLNKDGRICCYPCMMVEIALVTKDKVVLGKIRQMFNDENDCFKNYFMKKNGRCELSKEEKKFLMAG